MTLLHRLPIRLATFVLLAWSPAFAAPAKIEFNRDIRPILSDNCFYCHGPDKTHREAKMRLDVRADALRKDAFVPGKPDESELVSRIFTADAEELMPPPDSNKKLTPAQRELLKRWIAEGAEYQDHWAYIAPKRPAGGKSVDDFIRAALEQRGIGLSPEAEKSTLLRRLSLDLTGLPPTPEEVRAFLADPDAKAYERAVDRLLASPRYGERMAVPWLDVVRYADTVGFHGDQNVNVFPYRDYVVAAFNANKPFDRFTIEQLAGDLLPNPTTEQRVATAFNRLNMVTREGGAQPGEYLTKYAADRVRTVAGAWLGSTMGCAECHDHKFDPITARDFYSMAAFFADVKQWGVYNDYTYTPNPDLKGFSNDHPFPPEITVESPALQRRIAKLHAEMVRIADEALAAAPWQRASFETWRKETLQMLSVTGNGWYPPMPQVVIDGKAIPQEMENGPLSAEQQAAQSGDDRLFTIQPTLMVLFRKKPAVKTDIVLAPGARTVAAIRITLHTPAMHGRSVFRDGTKSVTFKPRFTLTPKGGKVAPLAIRHADSATAEPRYSDGFETIGIRDGWKISDTQGVEREGTYVLEQPVQLKEGDSITVHLGENHFGAVQTELSALVLDDLKTTNAAHAVKPLIMQGESDAKLAYLLGTAWNRAAYDRAKALQADLWDCRDGRTPVVVTESIGKPLITRVLPRGNWQDESGEVVAPAPPHFLPPFLKPADGQRLTRLDLAKWLVAPENPLTARVFMNRLWKQFFGNALSAQTDDVGAQGEWPSHPELLDWLAVEFRESGWDVKHMVKMIVSSATYRQASSLRSELRDSDPQNRLLASQNPRRLDAEFVRDNALAVAGLLNLEMGGPPVHPYQPPGYYAQLQFPDRDYHAELDERQYRRGIYAHWQRTFLHPMLANFDAPSREECAAFRTVANTPQQALTLLNDPTFVEAARVFAARLLAAGANDDSRIDLAFQQTLSRAPKPAERQSLTAFLAAQRDYFTQHADDAKKTLTSGVAAAPASADAAEIAAWTQLCRVVLNLHETITRY